MHNSLSIKETKEGIILPIFVKPNSPKFKIELVGTEIIVYSTEEPNKGKVNKEIMKDASKFFGFQVEIVSGLTSRKKVLLLRNANRASVETCLRCNKL
jgi:uncharacterized protein